MSGNGQTIRLTSNGNRSLAHHWIERAPQGAVLNIREASRTTEQNAKMWAMLSDVSRAKPLSRVLKPEGWKALFMDMIDKKPSWEPNLDGTGVVCIGYKSSHLSKAEMSDMIEAIYAFGAEHSVQWTEPASGTEAGTGETRQGLDAKRDGPSPQGDARSIAAA